MKLSFLPREQKFFDLLHQSAHNLLEAARALQDLMEHYEEVTRKVAEIKRLEEAGDTIIHEIMRSLHRTFVTPLDREDIALIGERMDDVVDDIEDVARNMVEYRIEAPTPRAQEIARIIVRCAEELEKAMHLLHFRGSRLQQVLPLVIEVNSLENEADQVTSRAIGELFSNTISPIEILKWREIYAHLESATDRCEDVADVLEAVVLKHA